MVILLRTVWDQTLGNGAESFIFQDLNGAAVRFQRVVEGQLIFRQPQILAPGVGLPRMLDQLNKLFNHLGRVDRPGLIATESILQQFGEGGAWITS